jgi:hypothetical protein
MPTVLLTRTVVVAGYSLVVAAWTSSFCRDRVTRSARAARGDAALRVR